MLLEAKKVHPDHLLPVPQRFTHQKRQYLQVQPNQHLKYFRSSNKAKKKRPGENRQIFIQNWFEKSVIDNVWGYKLDTKGNKIKYWPPAQKVPYLFPCTSHCSRPSEKSCVRWCHRSRASGLKSSCTNSCHIVSSVPCFCRLIFFKLVGVLYSSTVLVYKAFLEEFC